jgi:hypothetical protein
MIMKMLTGSSFKQLLCISKKENACYIFFVFVHDINNILDKIIWLLFGYPTT